MKGSNLLERTRQTILRHGLMQAGESVLVGVSGGPDSIALLWLLQRLRQAIGIRQVSVVHVHHGWRGAEADADAAFVVDLAEQWEVPVAVERVDASGVAAAQHLSLEDAARRLRYDALTRAARRVGADVVAVGHTRDDQAETVLMRLVRGSGLAGVSGMPLRRPLGAVRLVRPLLHLWRHEIEAWLRDEGVSARHDGSNDDTTFLRNRVRHQLLPLLMRDYNPQMKEALVRLADEAQADYAYLAQAADTAWDAARTASDEEGVALLLSWLNRAPLALQRQMLRAAIQRVKGDLLQIDFRHWEELRALTTDRPTGSRVDLPGGIAVIKHARYLLVSQATSPPVRDATSPAMIFSHTMLAEKGPLLP